MSNLASISECADKNQEILQAIIHNCLYMFENIDYGQRVSHYTRKSSTKSVYQLLLDLYVSQNTVIQNCLCWTLNFQNDPEKLGPCSTFDMDKLKSTFKQFVRDWSEVGQAERNSCYKPIIQEIQRLFPSDK